MDWQIIDSKPKRIDEALKEIWQKRELLFSMMRRELQMRFVQTFSGWLLSIFKPLLQVVVYSIFFTYVVRINTDDLPYPLFVLSGMLFWHFFLSTTLQASQSLLQESTLLKKNNIPRLMIPLYKSASSIVDFGISFILFLVIQLFFQYPPNWNILAIPIIFLFSWCITMGLVFWLNILSVRHRDINFLMTSILPFGIWLSAVFYTVELVPMPYQQLLYLNPIAGIIAWSRWALLAEPVPAAGYWIGMGMGMLIFCSSIWFFVRQERWITERI